MIAPTTAKRTILRLLAGGALGLFSGVVFAGNGLSDLGFGAQSGGMAGADLALARDTAALNINPAGLTQISGSAFDVYIEPYYEPSNQHKDALGNDRHLEAPYGSSLGGGYARHLPISNLVAGVGLFAQGGSGFSYSKLNTPFGTQDDIGSNFGTVKIEPGIGWQVIDALSIGASLGINYSSARQKFFPDTSYTDPSGVASFYGFRVDGQSGWSFNGKLGFQYRPDARWVLAGAYTSKTQVKLDGGTLTADYDALGFGKVVYRNAATKGLALAQEAGIGAAYRASDAWLVTAEVNWVDASSALKSSTLIASNPNNPQLPQNLQNLRLTSPLNFRDQYVFATGAEYRYSPITTLRFGFNYGRNPIPKDTLSPTLPLIVTTGFAGGFTRHLGGPWEISGSTFYQLPEKITYTNPNSPFGRSSERLDVWDLDLMISRRW